MDSVLNGIVERGMKRMAVEHARAQGANEQWIKLAEEQEAQVVWALVTILYGEPDWRA